MRGQTSLSINLNFVLKYFKNGALNSKLASLSIYYADLIFPKIIKDMNRLGRTHMRK
jgi:hypothetical protein